MDSKPSGSETSGSDYSLTSAQHHSYKKSFGRFLKKLSPKPRCRSKSPVGKNKSWITVEYRGGNLHHQQMSSSASLVDDRDRVVRDSSRREHLQQQPSPPSRAAGFFQTLNHTLSRSSRRKPCPDSKGVVNRAASESELISCRVSHDMTGT
ncbi:unnamed protein product [Soboliphyme baturini]|uniref:Phosphoinositide kinase, FYVE finger containing n=1 Tax=Soboliphyme baturini TaxID=241478 RepID=A0A183IFD7_9BILA|nr:unnamed protein product [Soboliphyme baturini]